MSELNDLFINGQWIGGNGSPVMSVNPATDELLAQFSSADTDQVGSAVLSAREAFRGWAMLSLDQRIVYLNKFVIVLKEEKDSFAQTISRETGKPLWESMTEINAMLNKVPISIQAYRDRCLELNINREDETTHTYFKPHGVVGVLGPFNLPGHLPNGHIVPALLAGNTCVFKPSELTPLTGQRYMRLWEKTGIPSGVINLVQGGKETGRDLCGHEDIHGIFFTGSFETGQAIHHAFGGRPEKILALEMGGNNPLIVSDVPDIKAACYTILQSAFITSGQRCTCARRLILIRTKQTEEILRKLMRAISAIKVGIYDESPQPFMGPVISKRSAQTILDWQVRLVQMGGQILFPMKLVDGRAMLTPGLMDVNAIPKKVDVEIFGPLLQVVQVNDLDEAIAEANNTNYGLAAGILTNKKEEYQKFFNLSRAGIVNWNRPTTGASSKAPFGGIGKSGNHRPSAYFAADYCSYPVATMEFPELDLPETMLPGIVID
ncbi:MAG: succinylglutamate-semialdehyde dehydrogenase [Candidatus Omnitrophota bacterium]